jgi:hypothetical protein
MSDPPVVKAVKKGLQDGKLSYIEVQAIIRSTFDHGYITAQERKDLQTVHDRAGRLRDGRAKDALAKFLAHLDKQPKHGDRFPAPKIDPGRFEERRTDLGKFSHGCFDVAYLPSSGSIFVTLRVQYRFEDGISGDQKTAFKNRLSAAVRTWDNADVFLKTDDFALHPLLDFRFFLCESSDFHFPVDVESDDRREWVGYDLNVGINTTTATLVHELGHIYGNYDEYCQNGFQSWLERRMWWHDSRFCSDKSALMSGGAEFRERYFDHFAKWVNTQFRPLGITYTAVRLGK